MSFASFSSVAPNPFGDPRSRCAFDLSAARAACEGGSDDDALAAVGPAYRWLEYVAGIEKTLLALAATRASALVLKKALASGCVAPKDDEAAQAFETALRADSRECASALLAFGVKMNMESARAATEADNADALRAGLGKLNPKSINRKLEPGACETLFFLACDRGATRCAQLLLGVGVVWSRPESFSALRALAHDKRDDLLLLALREGGLGQNQKVASEAAKFRPEPFRAFGDEKALCELVQQASLSALSRDNQKSGSRRL